MNIFKNPFQKEEDNTNNYSTSFSAITREDTPEVAVKKGRFPYVEYGENNMFPDRLRELYLASPINNSIISKKAMMATGNGFEMVENSSLQNSIFENKDSISLDYVAYGAYAMEVFFSHDFSKIVKIKRIDAGNVRSGYIEQGKIREYYYKKDWLDRNEEEVIIPALDFSNKESHRQLLYVKNDTLGMEYYGLPKWYAAHEWIKIDDSFSNHFVNELENGFSPSIMIQFMAEPTEDKKRMLMKQLNESYTGSKGNKIMALFSKNKDLTTQITPINKGQVDSQWKAINDQAISQIMTAHGVTSPMLFGIKTTGQLGGSTELETAYKIFLNTEIKPIQKKMESTYKILLSYNGENSINFNNYDLLV
jgi:hypothetical protein